MRVAGGRLCAGAVLCFGLQAVSAAAQPQQPPPGERRLEAGPQAPEAARSGILGRVLLAGAPAPGTRIFVYPPSLAAAIGPGFVGVGVTGEDGRFSVGLAPGSYKVGVRRRSGADLPGLLRAGDQRADVKPETVEVTEGEWLDLGDLVLRPIDTGKLAAVVAAGAQEKTATAVEGRVVGSDGSPRPGFFVQAYRNPEMMGKPDAVTEARGDGTFTLYLPEGGAYSLRARSSAGGAAQAGEEMGVVTGASGSRLEVVEGKTARGVDLLVGNLP